MDNIKNIISDFWNFIELKRKNGTKNGKITAEKIYNWLNKDNLASIIVIDNETFYFEKTNSSVIIPNYIYEYIKKWGIKQGYRYLYN